MKLDVVLTLTGRQCYMGQEPETIEFVTDGILEIQPFQCRVSYEESALTGLEGVNTTFCLEEDCITLTRTGKLHSQMVFREGVPHESLYHMEFGALMISVCATSVAWKLNEQGGTVDLKYRIEIEGSATGTVDYRLTVAPKQGRN